MLGPKGLASVMSIDLKTGEVNSMSRIPGSYNECEGIFPDWQHTLVEADRQRERLGGQRGSDLLNL